MDRIGGDAHRDISKYRESIRQIQTSGKKLFEGHTINRLELGLEGFLKSWFDEHYKAALREEFFENLKKTRPKFYESNKDMLNSAHILEYAERDLEGIMRNNVYIRKPYARGEEDGAHFIGHWE